MSKENKTDEIDSMDAGTIAQITELIRKMGADLADKLARQIAEGLDRSNLSRRLRNLADRQPPPPEPVCADPNDPEALHAKRDGVAVAHKDTSLCS